jgi:hypothetical protein
MANTHVELEIKIKNQKQIQMDPGRTRIKSLRASEQHPRFPEPDKHTTPPACTHASFEAVSIVTNCSAICSVALWCLLFVVCCSLFVVCCLHFEIRCLFVIFWLLFDVCRLLFAVCCLLFVICCLLFEI